MGDLRTTRTYKLLKDSLLELLSRESFDNIKVNDICNLAMVHRTTFYSHFADKYELLDYAVKDIENELLSNFHDKKFDTAKEFYTGLIMNILNYLGSKKLFFRNMLANNYSTGIITVLHNSAITNITDLLVKEEKAGAKFNTPIKIMAEFYSGAVTSIIMWWITSNSKISEEELCNSIVTLIFEEHK